METVKTHHSKPFSGLAAVMILFSLIAASPLVYFFINYLLGNEHPFYG